MLKVNSYIMPNIYIFLTEKVLSRCSDMVKQAHAVVSRMKKDSVSHSQHFKTDSFTNKKGNK